jgi:hypothetical protein
VTPRSLVELYGSNISRIIKLQQVTWKEDHPLFYKSLAVGLFFTMFFVSYDSQKTLVNQTIRRHISNYGTQLNNKFYIKWKTHMKAPVSYVLM